MFREGIARRRVAAFSVALWSLLGSAAVAEQRAPFRAPFAVPPDPLVEQLGLSWRLAPAAPLGLAADETRSPLIDILGQSRVAVAPVSNGFDVAEALIDAVQRGFALALERWAGAAQGAAQAARRAEIAAAYARRAYAPAWRANGQWSEAAAGVIERLDRAREDGLDLRGRAYPTAATTPSDEGEFALSEAAVVYAAQASGGRIDPRRLSRLIGARPAPPAPGDVLAALTAAGPGAGDALQAFNPPHDGYRALKAKLAELRSAGLPELDRRYAEARLPAARDDRAPGGLGGAEPRRPKAQVEAEIIANMERWRWLPRDMGENRVEVNIPDFELSVVRDEKVAHRARVIVGKEKTPTPVFSDQMRFIIVNPYWNVPPSILSKEMLPKYGGDLGAIAASGYEVISRHGQTFVRQKPGEANALGRIKFMFPNNFSVYLHDTPGRGLFAAAHRAFSHGCVRVDQPFRLAEAVLGPGSGWPEERVRKLMGGTERYINLAQPVPIHIEYFTAFVDERGRLQLRADLYGYSAKVRAALGLDG